MGVLTELDVAKAYECKQYIPEKLRKIAKGSGNTSAVVYSRRLTKSQGELVGITDEIFYKWVDDGIYWGVIMDLDFSSHTIERCYINKSGKDYIKLSSTQEEIAIFQTIMEFITKG
jgi:hypothetical protein